MRESQREQVKCQQNIKAYCSYRRSLPHPRYVFTHHRPSLFIDAYERYLSRLVIVHIRVSGANLITEMPPDVTYPVASTKHPYAIGESFPEIGYSQSIDVLQPQHTPMVRIQSKYQEIAIYSNPHYGKILVLDGVIQLTEHDADSYNEMMAHVPMMEHPNPKRVLVIGGGDGYVVSEVCMCFISLFLVLFALYSISCAC